MKIDGLLTAFLLLGGSTLLARMMTQGVESALLAAAVEWSARRTSALVAAMRARRAAE